MARRADNGSFWLSYSDLMTSMFFIMLVLFIVCVVKMAGTNRQLQALNHDMEGQVVELDSLLRLSDQFKELSRSSRLAYDDERRTFYARDFRGVEIFKSESDVIKPEYIAKVDSVGLDLVEILRRLHESNSSFRYQLVIEGNAAIPFEAREAGTYNPDSEDMYYLSYRRALSLYRRWREKGIDLRRYNTEILIAGSGFNGINRDQRWEDNNKRFVIQIIPKVARPDSAGIHTVPSVGAR